MQLSFTFCFKTLIASIILLVDPDISSCQYDSASYNKQPASISFELGGTGVLWSVNVEGNISKKPLLNMRIGAEFFPARIRGPLEYRSAGVLGELSIFLGNGKNKFELGAGLSYIYLYDNLQSDIFGDSADLFLFVPRIGYRIYSMDRKRFFKIAYTPLIVLDKNDGDDWDQSIIPFYIGISYGFQLRKRKNG